MSTITVIVTGASRGLGEATARICAQMGANVVLNARSASTLEAVARSIRAADGTALALPGDVSQGEDCLRLVERTVSEFGSIDALVNNAGTVAPIAALADAEMGAWERNLAVNLFGPVRLSQAALPYLRRSKGRVIHVSSGAAVSVMQGWSAYCSSKAALNHFSRVLAAEEKEITSITFRPGVVDTEMQAVLRREGAAGMHADGHSRFVRLYEQGELLPPSLPARSLALLLFYAPHTWSGEFIQWDEERVIALSSK